MARSPPQAFGTDLQERRPVPGPPGAQRPIGAAQDLQEVRVQEPGAEGAAERDRRAELPPPPPVGAAPVLRRFALPRGGAHAQADTQDFLELHPILPTGGTDGRGRIRGGVPRLDGSAGTSAVVRRPDGRPGQAPPRGRHGAGTPGSAHRRRGAQRVAVVEGQEVVGADHVPPVFEVRHPQLRRGRVQGIRAALFSARRPPVPRAGVRDAQPPSVRSILHRSGRSPVPDLCGPGRGIGAHLQDAQASHGLFVVQGVLPHRMPHPRRRGIVRVRPPRVCSPSELPPGRLLRSAHVGHYSGDGPGEAPGEGRDAGTAGLPDGDPASVRNGRGQQEPRREGRGPPVPRVAVGPPAVQEEVRQGIGGDDGHERLPRLQQPRRLPALPRVLDGPALLGRTLVRRRDQPPHSHPARPSAPFGSGPSGPDRGEQGPEVPHRGGGGRDDPPPRPPPRPARVLPHHDRDRERRGGRGPPGHHRPVRGSH
mmetsp:Transcript_33800/g.100808  ORF Transcript_33800/g.100808 Transcript_33800/m.100808 type:complete len:480 (+) Transcript_33800:1112-2551(+)